MINKKYLLNINPTVATSKPSPEERGIISSRLKNQRGLHNPRVYTIIKKFKKKPKPSVNQTFNIFKLFKNCQAIEIPHAIPHAKRKRT